MKTVEVTHCNIWFYSTHGSDVQNRIESLRMTAFYFYHVRLVWVSQLSALSIKFTLDRFRLFVQSIQINSEIALFYSISEKAFEQKMSHPLTYVTYFESVLWCIKWLRGVFEYQYRVWMSQTQLIVWKKNRMNDNIGRNVVAIVIYWPIQSLTEIIVEHFT